ncbi:MAG: energy-coupling factor transporter transmembrane protein EcfT [Corynebacterium sp.]|uniref:energy-coupling factor transporter transmembrane component T n=1 Tax=Corynebacterium sp. TaxID=1720 RepID=UPI0026472ABD|nr:energy-coupling factor transporter transmembrane component T [Corynebacterium sp.]MDN5722478.1 energy-coupling factor transporter transmembrane protein EcfT [Corynebacterium sp.]MDN6283102.1 energy-coupling factor transporter transmembrane protein EcfT [Corynebacterium sp.]MDN6306251.1 energy-coupling factor transporter transmembrane protein EcfT [Corynebacterium sp.]MDN6368222.1 energy-coupling factor transporter transmembrane protein EcfT [Corynebacterium sp.]MDN6375960.1 energy-coupling 
MTRDTRDRNTPRLRLDPRTRLIVLLTGNVLVLSFGTEPVLILVAVATGMLLLIDTRIRYAALFTALIASMILVSHSTSLWQSGLSAFIGLLGFWFARFTVTFGLALWFISSTRVSILIAALHALHVPRSVTIPLSVMIRFIPQAVSELSGVIEALKLRGFRAAHLVTHPVSTLDQVLVPMLTSVAQVTDDLAASALIRGLGSPGRRTSATVLTFTFADATVLVGVAAVVAAQAVL